VSLLGDFKEVADLLKKAGNIELYEKILHLREQIVEISSENLELKDKNQGLEKKLRQKTEMIFKKPFYYKDGDDVPHCPTCWETKSQAVHVIDGATQGTYICHHCRGGFTDDTYDGNVVIA